MGRPPTRTKYILFKQKENNLEISVGAGIKFPREDFYMCVFEQ